MRNGKVWLVGAGPSDEGLLTIKGKRILEQAEVVVYDALVGTSILSYIPKEAEIIYVGKRASAHVLPQEDINQLLVKWANLGKRVVRLKGGDPFLFGRGGEELETLVEAGIPFEVVPGVPSAIAVPAYFGIPVTHRDFCSSLHIITGHKKKDTPLEIDFSALIKNNGTFVFLMGVSALFDICQGFLKAGMDETMPVAVLSKGTTAQQKKVMGTIATIVENVKNNPIQMPAIIVIGEVCSLAEKFSWYENLPLHGVRILLTRPKERSKRLADQLRDLGAEVLEVPTIQTVKRKHQQELELALDRIADFQWCVFTSPAGVQIFFEIMKEYKMDIRKLAGCKVAAIGEGTKAELEDRGILVDLIPAVYEGKALGEALAQKVQGGDRILIPRASVGNQELVQILRQQKEVEIVDLPIYDTRYENVSFLDVKKIMEEDCNTIAVFTSSSTVKGFEAVTTGLNYSCVRAACIGKQTEEEARKLGVQTTISEKATIDSLLDLIIRMAMEQI